MAKQKGNSFFFRIDDASFEKFNAILDAQNDLCKKMGVGQMTRTQVLQNIINDQYIAYLNNTKDPDTTDRINMIIDSKLRHVYERHNHVLRDLLFEATKANAQLQLLLIRANVNIHNTDVSTILKNDELQMIISDRVAKKVFGNADDEERKADTTKNGVVLDDAVDDAYIDDTDIDDYISDDEILRYIQEHNDTDSNY